jgi:hypothetical protein
MDLLHRSGPLFSAAARRVETIEKEDLDRFILRSLQTGAWRAIATISTPRGEWILRRLRADQGAKCRNSIPD